MKHLTRFAFLAFVATSFMGFAQTSSAITVSFEPDDSVPLVYVQVAIRAGATSDPVDRLGLTRFMAQMLLRGTQTLNKANFDETLDQMGANLSVESRHEFMVMRGSSLSTKIDDLLALMEDALLNPSWEESEISKLRDETLSALKNELGNDGATASRHFQKFLLGNHPFSNPIMGTPSHVKKISKIDIQAQYDRLMRSGIIYVIATGNTEKEKFDRFAVRLDKKLKKGGSPLALSNPSMPSTSKLLIVDKPDRTQTQIFAGQIGPKLTDPDYFSYHVANHAFGGGSFSSRLMQEIRVKNGWSYGSNSAARFGTAARTWHVYLYPAAKDAAIALKTALQMVKDLKDKGLSQEEFNQSKQSLINGDGFGYNTPLKRMENRLLEICLDLPKGFMQSYAKNIEDVTLESANAAMKRFLAPEHLAITVLGTAKSLKQDVVKASGVPASEVSVKLFDKE